MRGRRLLRAVPMKAAAVGVLPGLILMGIPAPAACAASSDGTAGAPTVPARALREIVDPAAGIRWRLVRDPIHPAGPGRLASVAAWDGEATNSTGARRPAAEGEIPLLPLARVILGGDRILVEESTPVASVRLAGVALGPACTGDLFLARLEAVGKTVRVVALGRGHARLAAVGEVRP